MGSIAKALAFAAILLTAAAQAEERGITDTEILLGGTFGLTGPLAPSGQGHSLGIRVAVADVNAKGGINGRKLRLLLEDDAYVPARTVQNVHKLIDVDKIFALLGMSSSSGALATIDYITQTETININAYIMNVALWETLRPTTFSIGQGYPRLVERVVRYMNAQTPNLKWGVFVQDDAFGENILAGFDAATKGRNPPTALVIKFKRGQPDFASEMLRMKAAGINAIYVGGVFNEYLLIVREAKRIGMDVKFGFLYPAHRALMQSMMGDLGQGYLVSDIVATLAEPEGQAFVALAKKYVPAGELDSITRDSLMGYAAAEVLIEALKRCGREVTRKCVMQELEKTSNLKTGVMGPISFGKGVRFSSQASRIIMNDYANRKFIALTPYE